MPIIKQLECMEILDSRGRPTLQVGCELSCGARAFAQVPSGASTGRSEAMELRDGDAERFQGRGCLRAVRNVNTTIATKVAGTRFVDQAELDEFLIQLDGTPNKSQLGANAMLGVSLAFSRANAFADERPLYQQFAELARQPVASLPMLTVNLFSGGKHAGEQVPIQDVLVVPVGANSIMEGIEWASAIVSAAETIVLNRYGMRSLTADEGGLAPPFKSIDEMFEDACDAVDRAGLKLGKDIALAVDFASSHFYREGRYFVENNRFSAPQMIESINKWVDRYSIVSVEDGLSEDDWSHWPILRAQLADRAMTLGDDLLCTHPDRIIRAIDCQACDALLLKVNQIGTLTEAAHALRLARDAGWRVTISARSGETEDNWLADLAVGWGGDFIKVGSLRQSERLAKYNRLLKIERQTSLPLAPKLTWNSTD